MECTTKGTHRATSTLSLFLSKNIVIASGTFPLLHYHSKSSGSTGAFRGMTDSFFLSRFNAFLMSTMNNVGGERMVSIISVNLMMLYV